MKDLKIILIAFLLGVSGYSVYSYISLVTEKETVVKALAETKLQLTTLENEKQNLLQTIEKEEKINLLLKGNLKAGRKRINRLFVENSKQKEELELDIAVLKAENAAIREHQDKLRLELSIVTKEKNDLIERFNSASELKKALSELRSNHHKDKRKTEKKISEPKNKMDVETIMEGNKGFLIKDGEIFSPKNIKIEVNPADNNIESSIDSNASNGINPAIQQKSSR